jgi:uncharacterized damage-inducible protein DinB
MKTFFTTIALLSSTLLLSAQAPQPAASDPMSTWLRNAYRSNRNYLARTAEKVPEPLYSLRPGSQTEVRTLGQIIGHVANFNFLWCSQAKGEANPAQGKDFEKETSKAVLVKATNDALTYCDGVYAALTDASGLEMLTITQENGRQSRSLRMSLLTLNYGHNNEHYGNLVTLMRMKDIVPPSSEPR